MAPQDRSGSDGLTHFERLLQEPERYHLLLALRILEQEYSDAPPFGRSRRPGQEPFRLGQEASLAFPDNTITEVEAPTDAGPGRLTQEFFGLFGPHGPLPHHLTEYARERQRISRDSTFVSFANMLIHRVFGLFYRAWAIGQPSVSFDRGDSARVERKLAAIGGYGEPNLTDRDAMPDLLKRRFAGQLTQGVRHPDGLTAMLSDFFGTPVRLQEFVGSWLELEPSDFWQLGGSGGLGRDTNIGTRVWSRSDKFRLKIGPVPIETYRTLLPGSPSLARLADIVRNYIGTRFDWDLQVFLKGSDVPASSLGGTTQLGLTSWIGARDVDEDVGDLIVTAGAALAADPMQ